MRPTRRKRPGWSGSSIHNPQSPPAEGEAVIPPGLARKRALQLLKSWQANIHCLETFETLVPKADSTLGLLWWVRSLNTFQKSFASRAVEEALFQQVVERFDRIEQIEVLIRELDQLLQPCRDREQRFWGQHASQRVGWRFVTSLAECAGMLLEHQDAHKHWKSALDAVDWYSSRGWQLDQAGEVLFVEQPDLPPALHRVRARLRRGFLRRSDRIGQEFSRLLSNGADEVLNLPTAGEVAANELEGRKESTAVFYLDALRFDLGKRLAMLMNEGEPADRAVVHRAVAPIPSITALGMAFALPAKRQDFQVTLEANRTGFRVTASGSNLDLSVAANRRKWLADQRGVKNVLSVADVLDGQIPKEVGKRRLLVVYGAEFDTEGHDGQLQLTGAEDHLTRYAQAIRKVRGAGYSRILVTTDHGFFQWQPESDEKDEAQPEGELLWLSRRAIVGRDLNHPTALRLRVPQSDLEVMVPRSVNAFRTYGGLGFFHGGATLQELVIPVVVVTWPSQAERIDVVLSPVMGITSMMPRVEVKPEFRGQGKLFAESRQLSRRVRVRIRDAASGKVVFRHDEPATLEPQGRPVTIPLKHVASSPSLRFGAGLVVEVLDADDEEVLTREEAPLKFEMDEWD